MKSHLFLFLCLVGFLTTAFCPFCTQKVIDQQTAYETDRLIVLVDYRPLVKGHLIVIPKRHVVKAHELTSEEWSELSIVIPKIVQVFETYIGTNQYTILEKNGPLAFQDVPHVHFHLLPANGKKWVEVFNMGRKKLTSAELQEEVASFRHYFQTIDSTD